MLRERLTGHRFERAFRLRASAVWSLFFAGFALLATLSDVSAQAITRYTRLTGNINYVVTGGSLRAADNNTNPCSLNATNTQSLSGIPVGATIRAAYLYWGGSGTTVDSVVTLNGSTVNAGRTFTVAEAVTGLNWRFFGGFADVTASVAGNGSFTFGGLSVNSASPYCGTATTSGVVSGWSLVVVYERAAEQLRAINVFDGLDFFYGSSITRIADGFRIPASSIDGKMTVVTWEGETTNSGAQGGFSESLQLNGNTIGSLSYNSSSQFAPGGPTTTTHGVDIDSYDISAFLAAGQTTASAVYSSGQDFVLLTAKVVSVTSEPVVDLAITKSHVGNFAVGVNGTFALQVSNLAGSQPTDFPIAVSDTLPAGLSFVSGTGTGWSCGAVGQAVTCTHPGPLSASNSLPIISLVVGVSNTAFPSVTNTASVTTTSYDPNVTNNASSDVVTVLGSNLTTSTKSVMDLNGGDANPGDTLRYTITLRETAGVTATGVSVTDDVPGNVGAFSVVSIPVGATNSSTGSGSGANTNGFLNVTNITIPASGSVTIVFDVQISVGVPPGATIDNTATISNPSGADPTPSAPQVVVSASLIPGSGTKQLYLINGQGLTRTRPAAQTTITIDEGASAVWTLTQPLQQPVTLNAGTFPVQLYLTETDNGTQRNISVTLSNSALGAIATVGPTTYTLPDTTPTLFSIVLNTTGVTAPAGSTFSLTITNTTTGNGNRRVLVHQPASGSWSRVELNSASVIKVDSVTTYNAGYPGGVITTHFLRGLSTLYVRAVVSDPFGSFDITSANIALNPAAGPLGVPQSMTLLNPLTTAATKTYEFAFPVPGAATAGAWTITVVANEGVEGVADTGVGSFTVAVPMPSLLVSKISEVLSDPVNGTTNPKSIPLSLQRYTITVTNTGPGSVDASSLALNDVIPSGVAMFVDSSGGNPVEFIDGSTASGLTFNYATHVAYSSAVGGGAPFAYSPTPDANGVDVSITGVRIAPSGVMPGASGGNQPSFVIRFRVKVK
jgi:trimeric autotransporter adhesin